MLDEQLNRDRVLIPLLKWITVQKLEELRPYEVIKDDRIPSLLRELKNPAFVTIDDGFWNRDLLDPNYCILYFALQDHQQAQIPNLLRQLLKLSEFKTKANRMGKVAKVSPTHIEYWHWGSIEKINRLWNP